jgi:hypothetical protein
MQQQRRKSAKKLWKAILVVAAAATADLSFSGCQCTPPATRASTGQWQGTNCRAVGAPPCCGSNVCRTAPTGTGVCLAPTQCLDRGFECGYLDTVGAATPTCCAGTNCRSSASGGNPTCQVCQAEGEACLAGANSCCGTNRCRLNAPGGSLQCLPPLACTSRAGDPVPAGGTCCDANGNPIATICDPVSGCRCAVAPTPSCTPLGAPASAASPCCAPGINVDGVCCVGPGNVVGAGQTCCTNAVQTGNVCGECTRAGQPESDPLRCCPGLELRDGRCESPCVPDGSCVAFPCDGVWVPGTYSGCDTARECVPNTTVCRAGDGPRPPECGRRAGELCGSSSDCGGALFCNGARECVDFNAGPNQASTTCWLPTDKGLAICKNGERVASYIDSMGVRVSGRCP